MKTKVLLFLALICLPAIFLAQNTIHIPGDYSTIQEGINASVDGDTVMVDQGVYLENINLLAKSIFVTSNYINTLDSADILNTIIDGSNPADTNSASVVTLPHGSDTNSVICGFTIKGGTGTLYANRLGGGIQCFMGGAIMHNRIINNAVIADEHAFGSGIWAEGFYSSYFIIKNNTLENNYLENSINSYMSWGTIGVYQGNVIIKDNIIRSNTANGRPYGIGIYCSRVSGIISHNTITHNTGIHSLAHYSRGGAMYLVNNRPGLVVSNNEITHNQIVDDVGTMGYGGGIAVLNGGGFEYNSILIDGNIISDNYAWDGGAISVTDKYNITISNNVIRNNEARGFGGGIFFQNYGKGNESQSSGIYPCDPVFFSAQTDTVKPLIVNNTFTNNLSNTGGGIASYMTNEDFIAFNNIFHEDSATASPEIYLSYGINAYLSSNNLDTNDVSGLGTWTGQNNIVGDPDLADELCHLSETSLCINAGADLLMVDGIEYYPPLHDMENDIRPLNGLFDIGADEVLLVEIPETPPVIKNLAVEIFPNPFDNITHLRFEIAKAGYVNFTFYNHLGQQVDYIDEGYTSAGIHNTVWHAKEVPSGVYFYRLMAGSEHMTGKVIKR
jgi:hypothetical protein